MRTEVGDACPGMGLVLQGVLLGQLPEQGVCVQKRNVSDLQHSDSAGTKIGAVCILTAR